MNSNVFNPLQYTQNQKIITLQTLEKQAMAWRLLGQTIVFTNGCFDILHIGHLHTLAAASQYANKLVVGINSDASIKKLKGNARPIQPQLLRATLVASLFWVERVVVFEEETPYDIIKTLIPNVLVKGGDYNPQQIVGYDIVTQNGGEVLTIPFLEGHSTTDFLKKINYTP